jgi:hypothetical protein
MTAASASLASYARHQRGNAIVLSSCFRRYPVLGPALILLLGATAGGPARAGVDQWTSTGPFGGNVPILVVDPKTPSTLYAGAASGGGIFKSTDGGASWAPSSTGIADRNVAALAIDPATPTTLYASSTDFGVSGIGLSGVFKSTDGAVSWTKLPVDPNTFTPGLVEAFAIDPQTTSPIYAASGAFGILKSTDGGMTWTGGNGGTTGLPLNAKFTSIVVDPHTPTTLYAGSTEGTVSGAGLFKSTDGGATWTAINTGIPGTALDVLGLAVDPQTTATLYASMSSKSSGLYKSTNGGAGWTLIEPNTGGPIVINPQTTSTLYVGGGTSGVLKSTDGGASFTPVDSGLGSVPVNTLAINPESPATLYAGTAIGVFATTNAGAAWTAANTGLSLMAISALTVDPTNPAVIYAGTGSANASAGTGIFKSTDGGSSWTAINTGLLAFGSLPSQISAIAIDPTAPATLYAGDGFGDLFKSTNGGASWTESDSGISAVAGGSPVVAIAIDPQVPANVYAGLSYGVFKSTDGGGTWALADNGLPVIANGNQALSGLSIVGPPVSALMLSTRGNGVFTSTDGANTWNTFDTTIPNTSSANPQVSGYQQACINDELEGQWYIPILGFAGGAPTDAEIFLSCVSPDAKALPNGQVQLKNGYTFNVPPLAVRGDAAPQASRRETFTLRAEVAAGVTVTAWAEPDGASESACEPLRSIVGDPLDGTIFYSGGGCGVLRATHSGGQMTAMNLGLPQNLPVTALAITPTASDLYVGSLGGGVYRFTFVDSPLAAAVLPSSRSVQTGAAATAFATLINGGSSAATGCSLAPLTDLPAGFSYQTTVPGTNALTGSPNTPVSIPAGAYQTFLFSITPNTTIAPIDAQIEFVCAGLPPAEVLPGIDTLLVSGSSTPVPDVVALVATPTRDGIIDIPGTSGANAFAVATVNLGAGDSITATPGTGAASLPVAVSICQTNPASGQCLGNAAASVTATIAANATPTFAIFVGGAGMVPFDPAGNRIFVQFTGSDGTVRGSTSVAVRTQ